MAVPAKDPCFVWWSNQESYDNNIPSVLGIVEVGLAVWLYWWLIPTWFDTHWHLVASVCIAPLLLLRSKASIEGALDGFEAYINNQKKFNPFSARGLMILGLSGAAGLMFGFSLTNAWPTDNEGIGFRWWAVTIWLSTTAFLAIAVAMDKSIIKAIHETIGSVAALAKSKGFLRSLAANFASVGFITITFLSFPGVFFGYLVRALTQKTWSVLNHFSAGWRDLARNWRRLIFAQDFHHPPELLPEQHTRIGWEAFQAERFLVDLFSQKSGALNRLVALLKAFVVILPAWFYRVSLKSTFWFYWPLVFAQHRVRGIKSTDKTLVAFHRSTLAGLPLALFALALLVSPFAGLWQWLGGLNEVMGVTTEHLNLVALLGEKALLVWPAALVSLLVYVSANLMGPRAANNELMDWQLRWLKALIGLRWWLVLSALVIGLLLLAAESAPNQVPLLITEATGWIETQYFPLFATP